MNGKRNLKMFVRVKVANLGIETMIIDFDEDFDLEEWLFEFGETK